MVSHDFLSFSYDFLWFSKDPDGLAEAGFYGFRIISYSFLMVSYDPAVSTERGWPKCLALLQH